MVLFVLTGAAPPILIVTLLAMAYLTGYELRKEEDVPFLWKAWWVLLVILLNVVGFAIFWAWLARRRYKAAGRKQASA
jgi:heme/copper-type cytochrome/quinol oxidase subunit 2